MAKAGDLILEAARKQAEGEIAVLRQTLKYIALCRRNWRTC